jgi:hypothetical protein
VLKATKGNFTYEWRRQEWQGRGLRAEDKQGARNATRLEPRVCFFLLFTITILITCTATTNDKGSRRILLTLRYVFFLVLFLYFLLIFHPGRLPHHLTTTTSATAPNHDDHNRGLEPLVFSHINPHSHHEMDVSTCNCQYRGRHMTNGSSRRRRLPLGLRFLFLFFHSTNNFKIDYAYLYNLIQGICRLCSRYNAQGIWRCDKQA